MSKRSLKYICMRYLELRSLRYVVDPIYFLKYIQKTVRKVSFKNFLFSYFDTISVYLNERFQYIFSQSKNI